MASSRFSFVLWMPFSARRWLWAWIVSASAAARNSRATWGKLVRLGGEGQILPVGLGFARKGLFQILFGLCMCAPFLAC